MRAAAAAAALAVLHHPRQLASASSLNNSTAIQSSTHVGDAIAQGLGLVSSSAASANTAAAATANSNNAGLLNSTDSLSPSLSTICSDEACAVACDHLWQTWATSSSSFSSSYAAQHGRVTTTTHSELGSSTYTTTSLLIPSALPPVYTLCDHVPRVNASLTTSTRIVTVSQVATRTITTIDTTWPTPGPSCFVPPGLCVDLAILYASAAQTTTPQCSPPPGYTIGLNNSISDDDIYGECNLSGGPVRLLYWPVSTKGGLCANNVSTVPIAVTDSAPKIAVVDGTTLTSPTVYMSFQSLYGVSTGTQYYNSSYTTTLGPVLRNVILPEDPKSISSVCGPTEEVEELSGEDLPVIYGAVPLQYARLQQPVHSSDYFCALGGLLPGDASITGALNKTIFAENYNPTLLFPTDLPKINTAWNTCLVGSLDWFLFDPPSALSAVSTAKGVSVPNSPPTSTTPQAHSQTPQPGQSVTTPAGQTSIGAVTQPPPASTATGAGTSGQSPQSDSDPTAGNGGQSSSADPGGVLVSILSQSGDSASPTKNPPATSQDDASPSAGNQAKPAHPGGVLGSILGQQGSSASPTDGSLAAPQGAGSSADPGSPGAGGSEDATSQVVAVPSTGGVVTLAGQTFSVANDGSQTAVVLQSTTLVPGQALTVSHGVISLSGGSLVVLSGSPAGTPAGVSAPRSTVIAAGSESLTAVADPTDPGAISVAGTTLSQDGAALTTLGQTLTVGASGLEIASAGKTSTINLASPTPGSSPDGTNSQQAVVTLGITSLTFESDPTATSVVQVGATDLSVGGPALTTDGHTFSVASNGLIEDGTSTIAFSTVTGSGSGSGSDGSGSTAAAHTTSNAAAVRIETSVISGLLVGLSLFFIRA